ncbi:MAG: hypothetical protein U0132_08870 [Gemmatimonadaceae bacterium]
MPRSFATVAPVPAAAPAPSLAVACRLIACLVVLGAAVGASPCPAQVTAASTASASSKMAMGEVVAFAKLSLSISQLRDSIQKELAQPRNETPQAQQQLREQLSARIADALRRAGVSEGEFSRKTYVISSDSASRAIFDRTIAELTGAPLPGQVAPVVPAVAVPAGPIGVHIGHVLNAFSDTPKGMGLLRAAMEEARTAAVHAGFAARDPENLGAMKMHAGHVINAVDPSVVPTGPGLGYGVKRSALGVATHLDLAAKVPGASPNVILHAGHSATSARNTVQRVDAIVAIAQKIQAATTASDAASLVSQLVSLTNELVAGKDADADGKVTWKDGEGGLTQCEEHVMLLLAGEH